jgi:signal transduction histidine kinase
MTNKASVLIVDDNPENLFALEQVLAPLGLRILKAASGNEALARLLESEVVCILMDVQMPDMDGFEAASLIRSSEELQFVPIIFVTGHSGTHQEIFKGYEIGAVDYLLKPLDAHIVRSKVAIFADLYRQRKTIELQATQLAEANLDLERANKELDQFTAVAAHDLKSPLATIVQTSQYMEDQLRNDLDANDQQLLGTIRRAGVQLLDLVDDLLRLARFGRQVIEPRAVRCVDVVETVLDHVATDIAKAGAEIKVDEMPVVYGDAGLLYHVFQNLVMNALKYRRPDVTPRITVGANSDESGWCLWVRDNGPGIAAKDYEEIFQPFRRAHTGSVSGTGIGLAICQKIVTRHGGRIWVESQPAQGSTFYFTLACPSQHVEAEGEPGLTHMAGAEVFQARKAGRPESWSAR